MQVLMRSPASSLDSNSVCNVRIAPHSVRSLPNLAKPAAFVGLCSTLWFDLCVCLFSHCCCSAYSSSLRYNHVHPFPCDLPWLLSKPIQANALQMSLDE